MKKKKDTHPNFRHSLPSGHPAFKKDFERVFPENIPRINMHISDYEERKYIPDQIFEALCPQDIPRNYTIFVTDSLFDELSMLVSFATIQSNNAYSTTIKGRYF